MKDMCHVSATMPFGFLVKFYPFLAPTGALGVTFSVRPSVCLSVRPSVTKCSLFMFLAQIIK